MPLDTENCNVAASLGACAQSHPDQTAICLPTPSGSSIHYRQIDFSELENSVTHAASLMATRGVQRGNRVLVLAKPGESLIVGAFALLHMGAVPVVIDPGMGLRSFLRCVSRTSPEAVYGVPFGLLLSRIFRRSFRRVKARVSTSEVSGNKDDFLSSGIQFPIAQLEPHDPAAILFTSGSTGPAKGVCYQHGMFQAQIKAVRERFNIQPGEIDFPMLPVFALFNPALGMTTVVPPMNPSRPAKADAALQIRVMQEMKVTNSFGSPVLWNRIASHCEKHGEQLPNLQRVLAAGASVAPSLVRQLKKYLPNAKIYSPYGATEALPLTAISGDDMIAREPEILSGKGICLGKPLPDVQVRILKTGSFNPNAKDPLSEVCPDGSVGEIVASGPMVTQEYHALPEETNSAKIYQNDVCWHRMGDLGYRDPSGRIWFCGRCVEKVTTLEGIVFYTECCEQIYNQHPKVYRSALIGVGPKENRTPAIVIEPVSGAMPKDNEELQNWISELKALGAENSMTRPIQHFFFRKSFPVDVRHNAKIHRLTLARKYYTHGLHLTRD